MKKRWMFYYKHKMPGAPRRVSFEWIPNNLYLFVLLLIFAAHC